MSRQFQIAIDGPAAAGKSTVARLAAKKLGAFYVNTGEMYRTIALACLQNGIDPKDNPAALADALQDWEMTFSDNGNGGIQISFNGREINPDELRSHQVASIVSYVARIPEVRAWMLQRQRDCRSLGTIIMEGRDIGTVVLPDATAKFFITATPMERARRRLAQPGEVEPGATVESVAAEIAERDRIDSTREVAPLKPAQDAITIVTDGMSAEEVTDKVIAIFNEMKSKLPL